MLPSSCVQHLDTLVSKFGNCQVSINKMREHGPKVECKELKMVDRGI